MKWVVPPAVFADAEAAGLPTDNLVVAKPLPFRCSGCGADGHHAEQCPHDHLTPLREAIDEALRLWESKPDDAGQWRRIREALAKS